MSARAPRKARGQDCPDPEPLPAGLPPVQPLDPDILPEALRGWIMDIAERMQVPPDFSAAASIVALSAVIGRSASLHPKARDDWRVVPNLWGGIVSRSGLLKSPAIDEAMRPLHRLEALAFEQHRENLHAHEAECAVFNSRQDAWKTELKTAAKKGNEARIAELKGSFQDPPKKPACQRYRTADPTVEKLAELLRENPNGLLVLRDELSGWLASLDKQGREGDRAFYLEAWAGTTENYTIDRIGRGTVLVPALCVSLFGGIQPGPLSDYVYQATGGGIGDDGLLQRFQLLVWPDAPTTWRNVDRWPDTTVKQRVHAAFEQLDARREREAEPPLRFSPEAQVIFNEWRADLEARLHSGELSPAFESHLGKYRSLMPSLALIFHLLDKDAGPVGADCAIRAAAWCAYLESHAGRLYSAVSDPAITSARELFRRLPQLPDGFTARDIYRHCWARLSSSETDDAIKILADHGWVRSRQVKTEGRSKTVYDKHRLR